MLAWVAAPALAGDCSPCKAKKTACGSPCAERTVSPCAEKKCESKCEAKNPCAAKCKTKVGKCGECKTVCKTPKVDADIEKLKVVKAECSRDLCVTYQVDIENMCGPYDLIIQVKDDCNRIVYERVVALEAPFRTGDNGTENHYRGTFADQLAEGLAETGKLRAEGNVVARGTRTSIDREREWVRTSDDDHGYATAFYRTADIAYRPMAMIIPANQ